MSRAILRSKGSTTSLSSFAVAELIDRRSLLNVLTYDEAQNYVAVRRCCVSVCFGGVPPGPRWLPLALCTVV